MRIQWYRYCFIGGRHWACNGEKTKSIVNLIANSSFGHSSQKEFAFIMERNAFFAVRFQGCGADIRNEQKSVIMVILYKS